MTMPRDPLHLEGQVVAEKYRIEQAVGEGGFAIVYRAIHTIWNKPVAIKFFHGLAASRLDQRELFMQAFVQEGALLTELSSQTASIVQARDIGTYISPQGHWVPFMVLEWLDGLSLDDVLLREREAGAPPWTVAEMMGVLTPVANALEIAHMRGIAHRDIKPANLFVVGAEPRSGRATIKVLDFGVAKMMADNTQLQAALAKTGASVKSFSPAYGAPEQFSRTYGATGPWTDVFALALVALEMLRGAPILEGDDLVQLAMASSDVKRRPTPRTLGIPVSDAIDQVFAKALAVQPTERYARAGEFLDALVAVTRGPSAYASPDDLSLRATVASVPTPVPIAPPPHVSTGSGAVLVSQTPGPVAASAPAAKSRLGLVLGAGAVIVGAGALAAFFTFGQKSARSAPSAASSQASAPVVPAPPPEPVCPPNTAKIPAGQFFMGSDRKDAQANEKPSHNVKLGAFCMDLYEVTAKDYKACSDVGKCRRASAEVDWPDITRADKKLYASLCTIADPAKGDHPINCIGWEMAATYCKAQDKRLPTEAEWEYMARGPDGRMYPWGDEEPTAGHLNACGAECVAWGKSHGVTLDPLYRADDGYATTAPVGKFPAGNSRFGPFDVVGNVWEWTADWYGEYKPDDADNPTGPTSGEKKVIRGGAFNGSFASWLIPSFRYAQDPKAQSYGIGFRCAKAL
ncbi:bifunctional serine/threonine-protein kinase/formylglycine-generating enzyme family protein [Pendulispora rubella]|uniref:Bifunctional serine/threonine-protein kinase/formylglycine-generating enzyme family protein n=1 Tax=Pendulispora rubella TaxID=2741070 RepID=A0ABZ2LH76_9BACT